MTVKWHDVAEAFECDGSLRDIYVLGAGTFGWRGFWRLLQMKPYRHVYRVDDQTQPLPADVELAFQARLTTTPCLSVYLDTIQLNCHFFSHLDIELDVDPREVTSQAHVDALMSFMRDVGMATSASVVLTPEKMPELPLIRYDLGRDLYEQHSPPWP